MSVLLWPKRSARKPASVPPIADVIKIPNRRYVLVVSEMCQTCSRKIGKLFAAVKIASLNKKYAKRKKLTLEKDNKRFVSKNISFSVDGMCQPSETLFGSLKKMSIGSARSRNINTDGNSVSARGAEPKMVKLPFENGKAISNPANWPR